VGFVTNIDWLQLPNALLVQADQHGAGLAAIAALVGIPLVLWQIFQGARQEKARSRARRYAALASLPMTLSGINVWSKRVVRSLNTIYPWVMGTERARPAPHFDPPPSPDDLISAIEKMIEAAPGDRVGRTLAAIVSDIQVLNSRIGDAAEFEARQLRSQAGMIDSNLMLAASIYARAESLYDPARALSKDAPIDYSRVSSALNIMGVREGDRSTGTSGYPTVHEMVTKAHQRARQRRRGYEKLWDGAVEWWSARGNRKERAVIAASLASEPSEGEGDG
jgi:hypothetical protein